MPFAFTEHGVTMLASILNSERAIKMNIAIVRAFIALRTLAIHNHEILNQLLELRDRIGEHDTQLNQIMLVPPKASIDFIRSLPAAQPRKK